MQLKAEKMNISLVDTEIAQARLWNNPDIINPYHISLATLLKRATETRPDIRRQQLQTQFNEKSLIYEKLQRIPNITLSSNYDCSTKCSLN